MVIFHSYVSLPEGTLKKSCLELIENMELSHESIVTDDSEMILTFWNDWIILDPQRDHWEGKKTWSLDNSGAGQLCVASGEPLKNQHGEKILEMQISMFNWWCSSYLWNCQSL